MTARVLGAIVVGCLAVVPAGAQSKSSREEAEARQQRYEIGLLERVLESAVEHGVTVTRDRLQAFAAMPTELLLSDNAHARGFRLEGYGVFFDVTVPSFETTMWTYRTLDQNDLGLDSAMKQLQEVVKGNTNAEQALRRVELQVGPVGPTRPAVARQAGTATTVTGAAAPSASVQAPAPTRASGDPILADPNEAFRTEVMDALEEAMLNHSSSLGIGPNEWLTIAARGNEDRPRLAPADNYGSRTRIIRLRGSDLSAYLARQITKDEAKGRIEVRVY